MGRGWGHELGGGADHDFGRDPDRDPGRGHDQQVTQSDDGPGTETAYVAKVTIPRLRVPLKPPEKVCVNKIQPLPREKLV